MSTIDITKTYTTRSGDPVRIYAVDGGGANPVHGAIRDGNEWFLCKWREDGENFSRTNADLVPVKQWRGWKDGEAPKFFMIKHKGNGGHYIGHGGAPVCYYADLFADFDRLHEDGTTTPCGVLE